MVQPVARPSGAPPTSVVLLAVFLGGMIGGALRRLVEVLAPASPGQLPWGIFAVNLAGAFALGVLFSAWFRRGQVAHLWRPFLATGLLGALTTWSTFMADTLALARAGEPVLAVVYLVGGTAMGVVVAGLGWYLAVALVPTRNVGVSVDGGGRSG